MTTLIHENIDGDFLRRSVFQFFLCFKNQSHPFYGWLFTFEIGILLSFRYIFFISFSDPAIRSGFKTQAILRHHQQAYSGGALGSESRFILRPRNVRAIQELATVAMLIAPGEMNLL